MSRLGPRPCCAWHTPFPAISSPPRTWSRSPSNGWWSAGARSRIRRRYARRIMYHEYLSWWRRWGRREFVTADVDERPAPDDHETKILQRQSVIAALRQLAPPAGRPGAALSGGSQRGRSSQNTWLFGKNGQQSGHPRARQAAPGLPGLGRARATWRDRVNKGGHMSLETAVKEALEEYADHVKPAALGQRALAGARRRAQRRTSAAAAALVVIVLLGVATVSGGPGRQLSDAVRPGGQRRRRLLHADRRTGPRTDHRPLPRHGPGDHQRSPLTCGTPPQSPTGTTPSRHPTSRGSPSSTPAPARCGGSICRNGWSSRPGRPMAP